MDVAKELKTTPFAMTRNSRAVLAKWLEKHVLPEPFLDNLPKLGLMVYHCNTPIGVVFLRVVEGGRGMIDGFLCDPEIPLKIRTAALDQLITDVIKLAHHNDMQGVFGLTVNKRVVSRAKKLGFTLMNHKLVSIKTSMWNGGGIH